MESDGRRDWFRTRAASQYSKSNQAMVGQTTPRHYARKRRNSAIVTLGSDGTVLLSHDPESEIEHRPLREVWHGFQVRNTGRRVATGVRFQIFKIEIRDRGQPRGDFYLISDSAINLSMYTGARGGRGAKEATLIPSAAVSVALAYWREDHGMVRPAGEFASDYYDENCSQAGEYRFSVCAFDDGKEYTTATFVVEPG